MIIMVLYPLRCIRRCFYIKVAFLQKQSLLSAIHFFALKKRAVIILLGKVTFMRKIFCVILPFLLNLTLKKSWQTCFFVIYYVLQISNTLTERSKKTFRKQKAAGWWEAQEDPSEYIRECCSEVHFECVGGGGIDRYIGWTHRVLEACRATDGWIKVVTRGTLCLSSLLFGKGLLLRL